MCVCHYKYFRYNKLNTSCIPQYYCDDLSTSDRFLVQQILHCLAPKGHAHVAPEASRHVLDQNGWTHKKRANYIGFTFVSRGHWDCP